MNRVSWAGRVAGTIVAAWLAVAGGAKACDVLPPSLTATRVGNDVALAWTGALGIGESWVVYRGEIDVMWTFGRNEILIASVGAAMYTDAGAATDGADHYWLVRCEGPGGAGSFSNMAFKLARHLDTVPGFLNVYFVSVPGWLGLPDVADTSDPSPCTPAAGVGDGVMNADDLLCAWWTSGRGSLTLSRRDEETCAFQNRTILYEEFALQGTPGPVLAGEWTSPLLPGEAYMATLCDPPTGGPLANLAVIVGAHDPAAPCQRVGLPASGCTPASVLLNMPYHTRERTADEILCGLEGVAWIDGDGNGIPDTCPGPIFLDNAQGPAIGIVTFDNVPDGLGNDNSFVVRTVGKIFGTPRFNGTNYRLAPGEAYLVAVTSGHVPQTDYCPPHQ